MKKTGLYDRNRYPYNARLLQSSANSSFDTRGSDVAMGSGVRLNTSRNAPSTASERMADFDGFSDVKSTRSYASGKPRPMLTSQIHSASGGSERGTTISTITVDRTPFSFEEADLQPSVHTVTKYTKAAVVLQIFSVLLSLVTLLSPGWGRALHDRKADDDFLAEIYLYYGLFLRCTLRQYEEYWGDLDCVSNVYFNMAGNELRVYVYTTCHSIIFAFFLLHKR